MYIVSIVSFLSALVAADGDEGHFKKKKKKEKERQTRPTAAAAAATTTTTAAGVAREGYNR